MYAQMNREARRVTYFEDAGDFQPSEHGQEDSKGHEIEERHHQKQVERYRTKVKHLSWYGHHGVR